jgi:hypothetical protein
MILKETTGAASRIRSRRYENGAQACSQVNVRSTRSPIAPLDLADISRKINPNKTHPR